MQLSISGILSLAYVVDPVSGKTDRQNICFLNIIRQRVFDSCRGDCRGPCIFAVGTEK